VERTLNETERRVLGVLIEKALAQPQYYPMTLNAVVAACNQKNNRDPVFELGEQEVYDVLEALRLRNVVTRVMAAQGARVQRYRHEVASSFGWQKREQAVLAELLLRGPQTVGELRTRCARMVPFDNVEAVTYVLESLADYDPPLVTTMPRQAGQSAVRHTHLLYPEGENPVTAAASAADTGAPAPAQPAPAMQPVKTPSATAAATEATVTRADSAEVAQLRSELEDLQAEVAELHQELAELRKRLDALDG